MEMLETTNKRKKLKTMGYITPFMEHYPENG